MAIQRIEVKQMEMKPFEKIGSEWMLISAEKDGKVKIGRASCRERVLLLV